MATNTKFIQMLESTLQSSISDSATEAIFTEFVDLAGDPVLQTSFGTLGYGTIEPNTAREEAISFVVTANPAGTATLTITRGLLGKHPYGTGGMAFAHNAGSKLVVSNNPDLFNKLTAKDNDETVTGSWAFPETPTTDTNPVTKGHFDDNAVKLTGAQTVAGVKTFSSAPKVPDAVAIDEALTLGQSNTIEATNVKLTGAQTVAGVKTFSSSPIVPDATTAQQPLTLGQFSAATDEAAAPATTTTRGVTKIDTAPDTPGEPVALTATAARTGALAGGGAFGTPGSANKFVTEEFISFTDVSAIALAAGEPVGMNIEGKVAKALRSLVLATGAVSSSVRVCEIGTNKFIVGYSTTPSTKAYNLAVGVYNPVTDTVTFGSVVSGTGWNSDYFDFCKLDTDKFLMLNTLDSNSDAYYHVCTVSGSTISVPGSLLLSAGSFSSVSCCQLDTNKFAFLYSVGSGTGNFQGVATVSGSTVTVVYSSTAIITNINTSDITPIRRLAKLSSTKHVIVNGNNGYCVVIDSTSAYTAGTAFQPVSGGTPGLASTAVISESATSFIVRISGSMRKCSVSGTTITNDGAAVSIPNDGGGDLCIYNSEVYECHYNATTAALCGIYKITHSTNLIRTQLLILANTGAMFIANIGGVFIAYQSGGNFFTSAMAANFTGFVKAAVAQGATATVFPVGIVTGLSGLLVGARYGVANGAYAADLAGDFVALSETELFIR